MPTNLNPSICILSQDGLESTTEEVIDWLHSMDLSVVRINGQDLDTGGGLDIHICHSGATAEIRVGQLVIFPQDIKVVWYRRWGHDYPYQDGRIFNDDYNTLAVAFHLNRELATLSRFFFTMFKSASWLCHPDNDRPNKLLILALAATCGLDVPITLVSNNTHSQLSFARQHRHVITKAVSELLICVDGERAQHATYTAPVSEDVLNDVPANVFPSLLQERLDKDYEIRVFYLEGECHSMAMFTQANPQTQEDFRVYPTDHLNRIVPYHLPYEIARAIKRLMDRLGLDTGSIDFVKTKDGRVVFLEINPVGQFGMVSYPCNYFLERKVARALARRLRAQ